MKLWESVDESEGHLERAAARKSRKGEQLDEAVEGDELGKKKRKLREHEAEKAEEEDRVIEERIRGGAMITVRKLMRGQSHPLIPLLSRPRDADFPLSSYLKLTASPFSTARMLSFRTPERRRL